MKRSMKQIVSMALALVMTLGMVSTVFTVDSTALSYSGSSAYQSGKYYTQLTRVNLTGNQRMDIVSVAESQIGYHEGNNSSQISGTSNGTGDYTEYGRWYGLQSLWCAMFVSWAAAVAGVSTNVVPKHSYTVNGLNFFKNQGRAYSRAQVAAGQYTPQRGDIIYFKYSRNSNPTNHVGIVTGYSNGMVHTVEGNTSSSTYSSNGGVVAPHVHSINSTSIVYICNPNYPSSGSAPVSPSTPAQPTSVSVPASYKNWVFDAKYYADNNPDVKAVYPIHLNPVVREAANQELAGCDRIRIIEPLDVVDFHNFLARSYLIITDSGGIQEEAPSLGKPVLVMRDTTERPEGIAAGTLKLVGTEEETIYSVFRTLLTDKAEYDKMAHASNPYGDGLACVRIADALEND